MTTSTADCLHLNLTVVLLTLTPSVRVPENLTLTWACKDTVYFAAVDVTGICRQQSELYLFSSLRQNINNPNQISSLPLDRLEWHLCLSAGTMCVFVCMCWCMSPSPQGGKETLHIKQPGTAVLSDVIESNEILLSQRVLELRWVEQWGSMWVWQGDKEGKHPESAYQSHVVAYYCIFLRCTDAVFYIK